MSPQRRQLLCSAIGTENERYWYRVLLAACERGIFDDVTHHGLGGPFDRFGIDFAVERRGKHAVFGVTTSRKKANYGLRKRKRRGGVPDMFTPINMTQEQFIELVSALL